MDTAIPISVRYIDFSYIKLLSAQRKLPGFGTNLVDADIEAVASPRASASSSTLETSKVKIQHLR